MVEVFKTNIFKHEQAKLILSVLKSKYPDTKINFDLDDCDKILRVEGKKIKTGEITNLITSKGFECEILE